jgi:hypothetical protein
MNTCTCTRKNAQVVTNLQQTCSNAVPTTTGCVRTACSQLVDKLSTACWQLASRLLNSTGMQTCYMLFQQLVIVLQFNNLSTSCVWQPSNNLMKQQHRYSFVTSLRTHLVDKLWDFYVCSSCEKGTCCPRASPRTVWEPGAAALVFLAPKLDVLLDNFCRSTREEISW